MYHRNLTITVSTPYNNTSHYEDYAKLDLSNSLKGKSINVASNQIIEKKIAREIAQLFKSTDWCFFFCFFFIETYEVKLKSI